MSIILQHGNLIDGTGALLPDATVVIDGARISAVGETGQVEVPPGDNQVIDVTGQTIMPGMMDLHDHLHGDASGTLEIFVRYGMTEMEAIEAATRVAAKVMGLEDRLGTVESGKEADIIVVNADPLKDIRVLQDNNNIVLVLKAGQIVRQTQVLSQNGASS